MKKRLIPVFTIAAVILIGSLAYAADRRKLAKQIDHPPDPVREEEALRAELLDAVEGHEKKSSGAREDEKVVHYRTVDKKDRLKAGK